MYNIDVIFIPSSNLKNIYIYLRPWLKQKDALMKDMERDVLRRTILELIKKGHVHYTDFEKKAVATCLGFATSNTVRKQFYPFSFELETHASLCCCPLLFVF